MVGCALSQLKPSELYSLSWGKGLGLRPRLSASAFSSAKNVEVLGLYPIRKFRRQIKCGRQIMTSEVDPRTARVQIFLLVVDL